MLTIFIQHTDSIHCPKKMMFYIEVFFSKCDQIRTKLRIWSFTVEILNEKLDFLCCDHLYCIIVSLAINSRKYFDTH